MTTDSSSPFDADTFLSGTIDTALDTQVAQCPEGVFRAQIGDKMEVRSGTSKKTGRPFHMLDINWKVLDDVVRAELDRENVYVRQTLFLDLLPNGTLDTGKGKNVDIGRLRDALGQNAAGVAWSPRNLIDAIANIQVTHRSDPDNPTRKYAEVQRVTRID